MGASENFGIRDFVDVIVSGGSSVDVIVSGEPSGALWAILPLPPRGVRHRMPNGSIANSCPCGSPAHDHPILPSDRVTERNLAMRHESDQATAVLPASSAWTASPCRTLGCRRVWRECRSLPWRHVLIWRPVRADERSHALVQNLAWGRRRSAALTITLTLL